MHTPLRTRARTRKCDCEVFFSQSDNCFLLLFQRIATQVAEQWLVTSEANRVAAAESMMRLGKDALTSLRSYDGPFMSQPRHLLQEFKCVGHMFLHLAIFLSRAILQQVHPSLWCSLNYLRRSQPSRPRHNHVRPTFHYDSAAPLPLSSVNNAV